jgi:hypothetical protein
VRIEIRIKSCVGDARPGWTLATRPLTVSEHIATRLRSGPRFIIFSSSPEAPLSVSSTAFSGLGWTKARCADHRRAGNIARQKDYRVIARLAPPLLLTSLGKIRYQLSSNNAGEPIPTPLGNMARRAPTPNRSFKPMIQANKLPLLIIVLALVNLTLPMPVKAVDPSDTFYGTGAGNGTTTGVLDSAFGYNALDNITNGNGNTAMGAYTLLANTTGYSNTAVGLNALYDNTSGHENTASGVGALESNTTGYSNTAIGVDALSSNNGSYNTAIGVEALLTNVTGYNNTASGVDALSSNLTGHDNTASGYFALLNNNGNYNTASGSYALFSNTTGSHNTASGFNVLRNNSTGTGNTANGDNALSQNTTAPYNTATGLNALYNNTTGSQNTSIGVNALQGNDSGNYNTAIGVNALYRSNGSYNVALGQNAGNSLISGSGNVCIGQGVSGVAGENNTTRIRNVYGTVANGRAVYVNSDNKIGTLSSSRRFKEQIKPMENRSETLFGLKPVTFRYKKEIDSEQALSFGLIAEEVANVSPELVTRDERGAPQTVRYEAVNAMLLNEFLKEHKKVEELEAALKQLTARIDAKGL